MMKRRINSKLGLSFILLMSVVVTGCGGGGTTTTGTIPELSEFHTSDVNSRDIDAAAASTPIQGSVIQSNVNTVPNLGVDATKDTLSFQGVANNQNVVLSSRDSISHDIDTYDAADYDYDYDYDNVDVITTNIYHKSVNNNDFYAVGSVVEYGTGNNDYLSFGFWAYDSPISPEFGVYTDGGDIVSGAQIAALTGTASYEGGAFGVYNTGSDVVGAVGDVALTANFDTYKISGNIDEISFVNADQLVPANGLNVALEETSISLVEYGGFWTGDTLTTNTQNNEQHAGKWGGQFYGDSGSNHIPLFAAGTFGGIADSSSGAIGSFVGGFIAEKQ